MPRRYTVYVRTCDLRDNNGCLVKNVENSESLGLLKCANEKIDLLCSSAGVKNVLYARFNTVAYSR